MRSLQRNLGALNQGTLNAAFFCFTSLFIGLSGKNGSLLSRLVLNWPLFRLRVDKSSVRAA
jgi:hypothetical protein